LNLTSEILDQPYFAVADLSKLERRHSETFEYPIMSQFAGQVSVK
jgi:hypothetical protein